jgi:hypothetical protein
LCHDAERCCPSARLATAPVSLNVTKPAGGSAKGMRPNRARSADPRRQTAAP